MFKEVKGKGKQDSLSHLIYTSTCTSIMSIDRTRLSARKMNS